MPNTTLPKILIGIAVVGIIVILLLITNQTKKVNHFVLSRENNYFIFIANTGNQQSFDISHWKIGEEINEAITLNQAIQIFRTGQIANLEPIILAPGEKMIINFDQSPLGFSFRLTQCSGLLEQFQNFSPPLPPPIEGGVDYLTCLDRHFVEPNFFLSEWRVYLNQSVAPSWWSDNPVSPSGKLIKMFNDQGKIAAIVR